MGATKAGTSWLFDHLHERPEVHLPAVKELHYFDSLESGNGGWQRKQFQAQLAQAEARLTKVKTEKGMLWHRRLIKDLTEWLEVFDGRTAHHEAYLDFLGRGREGVRVIGDFTPSYGLLKEKTLRTMAGLTDRVRFVYLMRDPVERLWSNIRMMVGSDDAQALDRKIKGVLSGTAVNLLDRSNYRRTLKRLTSVIAPDALHIEYYERLFTPEAMARLGAFLGITPVEARFDRVVHRGVPAELTEERRRQLMQVVKPQYNFVERFMGELPAEWTKKMVTA
ncbi:MAG: hypothetical protein CR964_01195 [Rhodobacterales bacterium]|nr:MAG: hypothetical protein CR964_01195 [Rhodobacterales bacterium]